MCGLKYDADGEMHSKYMQTAVRRHKPPKTSAIKGTWQNVFFNELVTRIKRREKELEWNPALCVVSSCRITWTQPERKDVDFVQ